MPHVMIGCSGFSYAHWRGTFYPRKLIQREWLKHYCSVFSTVELNVTFYRLPAPAVFDRWYEETPKNFRFSLKGSRFITHVKSLLVTGESLELFFRGALRLKEKLKVILWQFPPSFRVNAERLSDFLHILRDYPVKNSLEFRHESWLHPEIIDICREYKAGLCMADWPEFIDDLSVTSDFVYIRRHGYSGGYNTCYAQPALKKDAKRIRGYMKKGYDVFVYFNNDVRGYAPRNADELRNLLSLA